VKRFSSLLLLLSAAAPVWADGRPAGAPNGGLMMMVPWIAILGVFYFLLIRPQQKQAKQHQALLDNLKRGDRVLTQGGLYGTIQAVKGKVLEVKLADDVKVLLARSHVSQVVSNDPAQETEPTATNGAHA
jgi:preprotein translocase subunit YajC